MNRSGEPPALPPDRSFGLLFTAVFVIVAGLPLFRGGQPHFWALGVSALFLALALFRPTLLNPLNRAWMRLGLLLHTVMTPLIMGLIFFVVITPMGLLMRLFGKRPLVLTFDARAEGYWIPREPGSPSPESMKNQF